MGVIGICVEIVLFGSGGYKIFILVGLNCLVVDFFDFMVICNFRLFMLKGVVMVVCIG